MIPRREILLACFASASLLSGNIALSDSKFAKPMSDKIFWNYIEKISGSGWRDENTDFSLLEKELTKLSGDEIKGFFEALAAKAHALDTKRHNRTICWKCSSDVFLYKRLAVVAQGEDFYHQILEYPRPFIMWPTDWLEGLLYVADTAFKNSTGQEFDRVSRYNIESGSNLKGWK